MVAGAFAGWLAVYAGAPLWAGVGVAALAGARVRPAACVPHGRPGAVAARVGPGHHAAGDRAELLRLPRELPEGEHAADHHAVRADGLAAGPGARVRRRRSRCWRCCWCRCSPGCCTARRLGLAVRMVGENPQAAEGQGVSVAATRTGADRRRLGADGRGGRVPHAVGLQRLLLQHGQRPRLDLRGAGGVRLVAAGQGAAGRPAVRLLRRAAAAAATIGRCACCPTSST